MSQVLIANLADLLVDHTALAGVLVCAVSVYMLLLCSINQMDSSLSAAHREDKPLAVSSLMPTPNASANSTSPSSSNSHDAPVPVSTTAAAPGTACSADPKHDLASHHHAVEFYNTDNSLVKSVSTFACEGLIRGQPVVIVATPEHRAGVLASMRARHIDVAKAEREGNLICADAHAMLQKLVPNNGNQVDYEAFETNIAGMVTSMLAKRPAGTVLRAYGEMVDVLWKQGREQAALQLEQQWNLLATRCSFALLCGYSMDNFGERTTRMDDICALHNHNQVM